MRIRPTIAYLLFSIAILAEWRFAAQASFLGRSYPIWIEPLKDFAMLYGEDLDLYCSLNMSHPESKGLTSRNLNFTYNRSYFGTKVITTVLNKTTIRLHITKPEPGEDLFQCNLYKNDDNEKPWGRPIAVAIGTKPEKVHDFKCRSINWSSLNCSWTPSKNPVKTTYRLFIGLKGRNRNVKPCPGGLDILKNRCIYSETDFRQSHKQFFFNLTGTNDLGSNSQNFTVNHYEIVIPDPPTNITQIYKTVNSCAIEWKIPHPMQHFPIGLTFFIQVQSQYDPPDVWHSYNTSGIIIRGGQYNYTITGLKYANAVYDIRVYLKSPEAPQALTSAPATLTFVTLPKIPDEPPATTWGSFDIASTNNSHSANIYWKKIPDWQKNGKDFYYHVTCLKNGRDNCTDKLLAKTEAYANFIINANDTYRFTIFSVNEIGRSVRESTLYLPRYETVPGPIGPTKLAYGEGVYGLTWSHPNAQLASYTVFYCEEDREQPLPCKGSMDWVEVPANVSSRNITAVNSNKFHQFGVAANRADGVSSGIAWATCVISPHNLINLQVTVRVEKYTSQSAFLTWEFSCTAGSTLLGYMVYYNSVSSEGNGNEKSEGPEKYLEVMNPSARNVTIFNLKPYTIYKIEVSILLQMPNGRRTTARRSLPVRFTTFEDAPDPPTNLYATNITNSSLILIWDLPVNTNGPLTTYILKEFSARLNDTKIIDVQDERNTSYEVVNLFSSTAYTFSLSACTAKCSLPANMSEVTTKMYNPAKMKQPRVKISKDKANITWEMPEFLAITNYIEILISEKNRPQFSKIYPFQNKSNTEISVEEFCKQSTNSVILSIRAINVDTESNTSYPSPWSDTSEDSCHPSHAPDSYAIAFTVVGVVIFFCFIAFIVFLLNRELIKCKEKKNVAVILPYGLQPAQEMEKMPNYHQLDTWPPQIRAGTDSGAIDCCFDSRPDEETLLEKSKSNEEKKYTESSSSESSESGSRDGRPVDRHRMPWEGRKNPNSHPKKDEDIDDGAGGHIIDYDQDARKDDVDDEYIEDYDLPRWQPEDTPSINNNDESAYAKIGTEARNPPPLGYVAVVSVSPKGSLQTPSPSSPYVKLPTSTPSSQDKFSIKSPSCSYVTLSDLKTSKMCSPSTSSSNSVACSLATMPEVPEVSATQPLNSDRSAPYVMVPIVPQITKTFVNYVPHKAVNSESS